MRAEEARTSVVGSSTPTLSLLSMRTDPHAVVVKAELSGVVWKTVTDTSRTYKKGEAVTILEVSTPVVQPTPLLP